MSKRKKRKLKARNVVAYSVKIRVSGAGTHTDKRFRRNQKRRKYDVRDGWE